MKTILKKALLYLFILVMFTNCCVLFAGNSNQAANQQEKAEPIATESTSAKPEKKRKVDFLQLAVNIGYVVGVLILLPIVLYTNKEEKLFTPTEKNKDQIIVNETLSIEERNRQANQVLNQIESILTTSTDENGDTWKTITNGKQAKFVKQGLDYINKRLVPSDVNILARIETYSNHYNERSRRFFTGSKWIIICAIALGVIMTLGVGLTRFIFIHAFGIIFYYVSSKTANYTLEKRMKLFKGGGAGFVGIIITALFFGSAAKHYVKVGDDPWKRDWESEAHSGIFGLVIFALVAIVLGFLTAFLGVINFLTNYSTSYLLPFQTVDKWYEKHFLNNPTMGTSLIKA